MDFFRTYGFHSILVGTFSWPIGQTSQRSKIIVLFRYWPGKFFGFLHWIWQTCLTSVTLTKFWHCFMLQNLLVIIQKLTCYHFKTYSSSFKNLIIIIENLLVIIRKLTSYNSKTYSLSLKTYLLSFENLLVIILKPTRYHLKTYSSSFKNLLVIIENLLVIIRKLTCYHSKTYSLSLKNLLVII